MLNRRSLSRLTEKSIAGAALLFIGPAAWAGMGVGGTVVYAPLSNGVTAVPTLGEWMLVLMTLLVAVIAFRGLRGRVNGRLLSNLTLIGGTLAAAAASHGLIQEARAVDYDQVEMVAAGKTELLFDKTKLNNETNVPLRIISIQPNDWSIVSLSPQYSPQCAEGQTVAPGAFCHIQFEASWKPE